VRRSAGHGVECPNRSGVDTNHDDGAEQYNGKGGAHFVGLRNVGYAAQASSKMSARRTKDQISQRDKAKSPNRPDRFHGF
jgi:hypothetical protein